MALHGIGGAGGQLHRGAGRHLHGQGPHEGQDQDDQPEAVLKDLDAGRVVIVAGFQGIDEEGQITTLGRGGSDLTAIALAAALKADKCEIYTDVDGVYTADPGS
jgi:aspartate kinase